MIRAYNNCRQERQGLPVLPGPRSLSASALQAACFTVLICWPGRCRTQTPCSGDDCLPKRKSAIIGRKLFRRQHAYTTFSQRCTDTLQQQAILKDTAAKHDGIQGVLISQCTCGLNHGLNQALVKACGNYRSFNTLVEIRQQRLPENSPVQPRPRTDRRVVPGDGIQLSPVTPVRWQPAPRAMPAPGTPR